MRNHPIPGTKDRTHQVGSIDDKIILDALLGGHGAEGSTTVSIVPWVRGHGGGNQYSAAGFLTYAHDEGFRKLSREQEYVHDLNAASKPADKVRIAADSMTPSESKTTNSLYLDPPATGDRDFGKKGLREGGLDLGGNTVTFQEHTLGRRSPHLASRRSQGRKRKPELCGWHALY